MTAGLTWALVGNDQPKPEAGHAEPAAVAPAVPTPAPPKPTPPPKPDPPAAARTACPVPDSPTDAYTYADSDAHPQADIAPQALGASHAETALPDPDPAAFAARADRLPGQRAELLDAG